MSKKPTILTNNLRTEIIQIRSVAVEAAAKIYRGVGTNTSGGRANVVELAKALEQFILAPLEEGEQ